MFDDPAWFHVETPYQVNYTNTRLPEARDVRDFTFPSGQRIQILEPNEHYELTFWDRDVIAFDLDWHAANRPWVRTTRDRRLRGGGEPHQWSAFRRGQMGLIDIRADRVGDVWS